MNTQTDTPRTDDAMTRCGTNNAKTVFASLARDLERENTRLRAALEEMVVWSLKMNRVPRPDSPIARARAALASTGA